MAAVVWTYMDGRCWRSLGGSDRRKWRGPAGEFTVLLGVLTLSGRVESREAWWMESECGVLSEWECTRPATGRGGNSCGWKQMHRKTHG